MDARSRLRPKLAPAAALWLLGLAACGGRGEERAYARDRRVDAELRPAVAGASNAERFDPRQRPHEPAVPARDPSTPAMRWSTPEGWSELEPTQMRVANLLVEGEAGRAECYLSVLPGDAGGAAANVDRWRSQMGLEAEGEAGLAALERRELLGQEAYLVDLQGAFTGMDGERVDDARLLGLILAVPVGTLFVKMTGPSLLVEAERDRFLAFCESIHLEVDGRKVTGAPGAPGSSADREAAAVPASDLRWVKPGDWREQPPRPTREVSFLVGAGDDCECYVTVLPGTAGGVEANLQRWRSQLDLEPLAAGELAGLPLIDVLGVPSALIEAYGRFEGMDGSVVEQAGLLGVVCPQADRTVFVKLVGPADTVRAALGDFRAFCQSLGWRP